MGFPLKAPSFGRYRVLKPLEHGGCLYLPADWGGVPEYRTRFVTVNGEMRRPINDFDYVPVNRSSVIELAAEDAVRLISLGAIEAVGLPLPKAR